MMKNLLLLSLLAAGKFGQQPPVEDSQMCQPEMAWPLITQHLPDDSLVRLTCEGTPYAASSACQTLEKLLKDTDVKTHNELCWCSLRMVIDLWSWYPHSPSQAFVRCIMNNEGFEKLSPDEKWSEHKKITSALHAIETQEHNNPYVR